MKPTLKKRLLDALEACRSIQGFVAGRTFAEYERNLMLRSAVEEPSRRAAFAAVWSVFACLDVPLVVATAAWWKPGKALPIEWTWPRFGLLAAMALVGALLTVVRARRPASSHAQRAG